MQEGKKGGVGYVPMHHIHLSHPKDTSTPARTQCLPTPHTFFCCPLDCQYVAQLGSALIGERVNGVIGERVNGGNGKWFNGGIGERVDGGIGEKVSEGIDGSVNGGMGQ